MLVLQVERLNDKNAETAVQLIKGWSQTVDEETDSWTLNSVLERELGR